MAREWICFADKKPPQGVHLETKVEGESLETVLIRAKHQWWTTAWADHNGTDPTHWREIA